MREPGAYGFDRFLPKVRLHCALLFPLVLTSESSDHLRVHPFFPLFSFSRPHSGFAELPFISLSQFAFDLGDDPPWAEKADARLNWRGSTTGSYFGPHFRWRSSQRPRLVGRTSLLPIHAPQLTLRGYSGTNALDGGHRLVRHTDPTGTSLRYTTVSAEELADRYYDVAFTGHTGQCDPGTCEAVRRMYTFKSGMSASQSNQYKCVSVPCGLGCTHA